MSQQPRVPSGYRLVRASGTDDLVESARTLARAGAEDGTLVWVPREASAPAPDDFVCALVLRPECPPETAVQLSYVGMLGLVEALGSVLPPAPLTFAWPGSLMLRGHRLAEVRLETPRCGETDWVLLSVRVHVGRRRPPDVEQAASLYEEGLGDVATEDLLEGFARHFLSWVTRWLDDGFSPIRASWMKRAEGVGTVVTVPVGDGRVTGTFLDLDATGRIEIDVDGERRTIELSDTPFAAKAPA